MQQSSLSTFSSAEGYIPKHTLNNNDNVIQILKISEYSPLPQNLDTVFYN